MNYNILNKILHKIDYSIYKVEFIKINSLSQHYYCLNKSCVKRLLINYIKKNKHLLYIFEGFIVECSVNVNYYDSNFITDTELINKNKFEITSKIVDNFIHYFIGICIVGINNMDSSNIFRLSHIFGLKSEEILTISIEKIILQHSNQVYYSIADILDIMAFNNVNMVDKKSNKSIKISILDNLDD